MRTLLIADDERTIREGIARAIDWASIGFGRVLLAANGLETMAMIESDAPDVVILDIVMPEIDGIGIVARCADREVRPEFVILSGYGEFEYAREAMQHGVHNYLLKPCAAEELQATVMRIVAQLDRQNENVAAKRSLESQVSTLMSAAAIQAFREHLTGNGNEGTERILLHFLKSRESLYRILLLSLTDADDYAQLARLRQVLETRPDMEAVRLCAVLDRCVAAAVVDNEAKDLSDFMRKVRQLARDRGVVDIRAALSDGGGFADLAALYAETREAIRYAYAFESEGDANGGTEASGIYIDASAPRRCKPVLQAMRYVREHLDDPALSLTRLASDILFMNPDYFGKLFKREVGVKFSDFILSTRMEKARQLISSSADVRVYEVARQIGLGENTAYFSQLFKKYTGMLPSEYSARNANRTRREGKAQADSQIRP